MATVLSFTFGTFSGLGAPSIAASGPASGAQAYLPRGLSNERLSTAVATSSGGGATRPTVGQIWPRGNTRGNS